MESDQPCGAAPAARQDEAAEAVVQVLATIDELAHLFVTAQEVLAEAARRLAKPTRAELEGMRDLRHPVTPEAFLLARLHLTSLAVENAWSWLESIDSECFAALKEAFARSEFPADLVRLRDLALGAGQGELVGREGLDTALAFERASAVEGPG